MRYEEQIWTENTSLALTAGHANLSLETLNEHDSGSKLKTQQASGSSDRLPTCCTARLLAACGVLGLLLPDPVSLIAFQRKPHLWT